MSLVQRTVDGQEIRRSNDYDVMVGVGPDGSLVPIATDAEGNVLMTTQGIPGVLSDAITLRRSPLYSPVAGVNPQGNSQLFAVDAQGRAIVVLPPGTTLPEVGTIPGTVAAGDDSRFIDSFTPEMFGGEGDGVADDTAAMQAAIDAAQDFGSGLVRLSPKTYRITAPLIISGPCTIEGSGTDTVYRSVVAASGGNVEAVNIPSAPPWLSGTTLLQSGAGQNALTITAVGAAVHLRNFGIRFADSIKFGNTGHGVAGVPPTVAGGFQDSGLMGASVERVTVYGHDGNHYAFNITNPLNCYLANLSAFGGGGLRINTNGQINVNNYLGNVVCLASYMVTMVPGMAHAYDIDAVNGETILMVFLRPQAWVKDVRDSGLVNVTPYASQRTFNVVPPTTQNPFSGGSSWLTIIAPDLETTVPGVTYNIPNAQGIFLGPGLINDYSSQDSGGNYYNRTVQDVRLDTLRIYNGELTNLGITTLRAQNPGAGVLNLLGAAGQAAETLTVRDHSANVLAVLDALGAYLNHMGGWRVEGNAVFPTGTGPGTEGGYATAGTDPANHYGFLQAFNRTLNGYEQLRLRGFNAALWGNNGLGLMVDNNGYVSVSNYFDIPSAGAPPLTPPAGSFRFWGNPSDGKLHVVDHAGVDRALW